MYYYFKVETSQGFLGYVAWACEGNGHPAITKNLNDVRFWESAEEARRYKNSKDAPDSWLLRGIVLD